MNLSQFLVPMDSAVEIEARYFNEHEVLVEYFLSSSCPEELKDCYVSFFEVLGKNSIRIVLGD